MAKKVSIYGRSFVVGGGETDDYYRYLPDGSDVTDPVLRALRPFVARDAVCIDAGANIGLYSLALSTLTPEGHVYSFEPSPSAFGHLEENLRVNGAGNVDASALALSDRVGTVRFHDFPFFSAGSFASDDQSLLTTDSYGSNVSSAPTTTIDNVVAERGFERVDFLKIDVEGAELSVLEGARKMLAEHRPTVVLEFNSFGFTIHQGILPQVALARIRELFPYIFVIDRVDGALARLETPHEEYEFLYDNGIHGPADNLLCSFVDLDVTRRYSHTWTMQPAATQLPAGAVTGNPEVDAMRRTVSWRITRPLRQARSRLDGSRATPWLDRLARITTRNQSAG